MDLGLKDATAVVVGGGRGMGPAAARCLADDGARVALVGRNRAVLDSATADLSLRGSPDAVALVADTEDEQQVQRVYALMAAIDKHFGHPAHVPRAGLPDEIGSVASLLGLPIGDYPHSRPPQAEFPAAGRAQIEKAYQRLGLVGT